MRRPLKPHFVLKKSELSLGSKWYILSIHSNPRTFFSCNLRNYSDKKVTKGREEKKQKLAAVFPSLYYSSLSDNK